MKKAIIRTPVKDLKKGETIEHYNAVLLEDIKSKMEQVIEGMDVLKNTLQNEIREFRKEMNERFESLLTALQT